MNYKRCISTIEGRSKHTKVHMLEIEGKMFISDSSALYRIDEPFSYSKEKYQENEAIRSLVERDRKNLKEATISNIILDIEDSKPKVKLRCVYAHNEYIFVGEKYLAPIAKAKLKYYLREDGFLLALDALHNTAALVAPVRLTPKEIADLAQVARLVTEEG